MEVKNIDFEQWKGFEKGEWKRQIDVRSFIQKNYTPYVGDSSFLTGTTEKTKKLWDEVLELYKKEKEILIKGNGNLCGSWMVKGDMIKAGEFEKIKKLTREAKELAE